MDGCLHTLGGRSKKPTQNRLCTRKLQQQSIDELSKTQPKSHHLLTDCPSLLGKQQKRILSVMNESLKDTQNLPPPDVQAREIAENLQNALEQFTAINENLQQDKNNQP